MCVVFSKTTSIKACSNKQDGQKGERRCAMVQRNCVLFYLVIVLRERNQARLELFSKNLLTFPCYVGSIHHASLFMTSKERYN